MQCVEKLRDCEDRGVKTFPIYYSSKLQNPDVDLYPRRCRTPIGR